MAVPETPGPRSIILEARQRLARKVKEIVQAKPKGIAQEDILEVLRSLWAPCGRAMAGRVTVYHGPSAGTQEGEGLDRSSGVCPSTSGT
eukprot:scaffold569_cov408-Prasinococcus_capsulatus_cf.AAC.48